VAHPQAPLDADADAAATPPALEIVTPLAFLFTTRAVPTLGEETEGCAYLGRPLDLRVLTSTAERLVALRRAARGEPTASPAAADEARRGAAAAPETAAAPVGPSDVDLGTLGSLLGDLLREEGGGKR
jgi:hypothetical protein